MLRCNRLIPKDLREALKGPVYEVVVPWPVKQEELYKHVAVAGFDEEYQTSRHESVDLNVVGGEDFFMRRMRQAEIGKKIVSRALEHAKLLPNGLFEVALSALPVDPRNGKPHYLVPDRNLATLQSPGLGLKEEAGSKIVDRLLHP